jgi:hypothetical protein
MNSLTNPDANVSHIKYQPKYIKKTIKIDAE